MKTKFTQLFGIKFPIVKSALIQRSTAALVADVANTGGLGFLCGLGLGQSSPAELANEITKTANMTDKPFGVSLALTSQTAANQYIEYVNTIIALKVSVVEVSGNNISELIKVFTDAGVKVIAHCYDIEQACQAEHDGCVAIMLHPPTPFEGSDDQQDLSSLLLLEQVTKEIKVPVIAGGYFNQAGAVVAAFSLGAQAVNMGNLFLSCQDISVEDLLNNLVTQASYIIDTKLKPLK